MIIKADGDVGIGTASPSARLHVRDSINESASNLSAHVALIENTSTGTNADVLALKVGQGSPGGGNNFITFFGGDNTVGAIEGDGSGGISINYTTADYAEWLPRSHGDEVIAPGDIVGVFGGKITKETQGADHVLAISSTPLVLGNRPGRENEHLYEKVAFLGQVPVKVQGAVKAGDFIVPSGLNDGTGVAVSPQEMSLAQYAQIVGRAWESSDEQGIRLVNTVVGLDTSCAEAGLVSLMQAQQEEIETLRAELENLKAVVAAV